MQQFFMLSKFERALFCAASKTANGPAKEKAGACAGLDQRSDAVT
jgi:hypothetical protein